MKRFITYIILSLSVVLGSSSLFAQSNALTGSSIEEYATLELSDELVWDLTHTTNGVNTEVKLSFFDDLTYYDAAWSLTVEYAYSYESSGGTTVFQGPTESLTIDFDPNGGETYVDRSLKLYSVYPYPSPDEDDPFMEDEGLSKLIISDVSFTGSISAVPEAVSLEITHHIDRDYELDITDSPALMAVNPDEFGFSNSIDPEYLELSWSAQEGALTYDLEWLFVEFEECEAVSGVLDCPTLVDMEVNYQNASRIETKGLHYKIPLAYNRGYLLYRVRGVGINYRGLRSEGAWSPYLSALSLSTIGETNKVLAYKGLERDKNWTYSANYAEEGKHKELISFFDGSLRNRQAIIVLNEDDHAVIAETKYDYQGREALQIMPYPALNDGLGYYENQNYVEGAFSEAYDREHFDQDVHVNKEFTPGVGFEYSGAEQMASNVGNGASNYYSTEGTHPVEGVNNEYIPSAEGYPYSRTVYSNDGLNRILRTGVPGATHEISSGRGTEMVYTTINESADLDRLFGNEVGKNGYLKNYIEDSNGEITVVYYDLSGRMIASGLMSNETSNPNLKELDYKPDPATLVQNLSTGLEFVDGELIGTSDIFSSHPVLPTNFEFNYELSELNYSVLCGSDDLFNDDCRYDLEIHLYNEDWEPMDFVINQYDSGGTQIEDLVVPFISAFAVGSDYAYSFEMDLLPGLYHVKKILRLNEAIIPSYLSAYEANLWASTECLPDTIPYPENDCSCDEAEIEYSDECSLRRQRLLDDMGPGGQYFDNIRMASSSSYDENAWLEAMDSEILSHNITHSLSESTILESVNEYTNKNFSSWDELKCALDVAEAIASGEDVPVCSYGSLGYDLPEDWIEASLLAYHPEYFQYVFHCQDIVLSTKSVGGGSSDTGTLIYTSEDVEAYKTRVAQDANLLEQEQILKSYFDPLNLINNNASPFESNGTYAIPSGLEYFVEPASASGYDIVEPGRDKTVDNFHIDSYPAAGNVFAASGIGSSTAYPVDDIFEPLYDHLSQFLVNEGFDDFYTIWDVLAYGDDEGVLYTNIPDYTAVGVPDHIEGLLTVLYDTNTGILATTNPNHLSKLAYFTGRYIFYREYLLYHRSEALESEFRTLYPLVQDDITDVDADFEDRFSLGLVGIDWTYHFQGADILYTDINTSEVVCFACPEDLDYMIHFPHNTIYEVYEDVDAELIDLYADVENTGVTVSVTDMTATTDAIVALYDATNPYSVTTISDEECGQDCIFSAELWITSYINCDLSEAGLDALKTQLASYCAGTCDGETAVTAPWTYSDANDITISTSISSTDFGVIDVSITQTGTELCSGSITFMVPETDQLDCGCDNMSEYMSIKGYNGDYSTMAVDLYDASLTINMSDFNTGWITYCNNYQSTSVGTLDGLLTSGGVFPDQWLDCGYIYTPTNCEYELSICEEEYGQTIANIAELNDALVGESNLDFEASYRSYCKEYVNELFTVSSDIDEYSYTLYYYDQAGNLIKTVPPSGVDVLLQTASGSDVDVDAVVEHRYNPFKDFVHPSHNMVTNYKYNSLDQVREQTTPDGGNTRFWYDALGRIQISQNAKQGAMTPERYSYMIYDGLGRLYEFGEKEVPTGSVNDLDPDMMDQLLITQKVMALIALENSSFTSPELDAIEPFVGDAQSVAGLNTAITSTGLTIGASTDIDDLLNNLTFDEWMDPSLIVGDATGVPLNRYEVVKTHYTVYVDSDIRKVFNEPEFGSGLDTNYYGVNLDQRNNTRNRVASVSFTAETANGELTEADYNNAMHYSYDKHGNVKSMIQELHAIDLYRLYKRTDYTYDLVSGNVLEVSYQKGQTDQFFHRYHYDSDNRITATETSTDGLNWDQEISYDYYSHGSLAREEIGAKQVQGMDYVYNIHGWLKAVNGTRKDTSLDIGKDGYNDPLNGHRYTAKDAFGYSLNYYEGDYTSQSDDFLMTFEGNDLGAYADYKNLYNGNISQMITHISDLDVQAGQYTYDQNNRLKEMLVYKPGSDLLSSAPFSGQSAETAYQTSYKYDLNGNLMGMTRNDATGSAMDDFSYRYDGVTDANGENLPVVNNQLKYVDDTISSSANDDMDDQDTGNYNYDEIGQLIKDTQADIEEIKWAVQNKIKEVLYDPASGRSDMAFEYNAMGMRVLKVEKPRDVNQPVKPQTDWKYTYYAYDVNGRLMAIYDQSYDEVIANTEYKFISKVINHPIIGLERIGIYNSDVISEYTFDGQLTNGEIEVSGDYLDMYISVNDSFEREVGGRSYELKNHLGNVLVTVSDRKVASGSSGLVNSYTSDVLSYSDYYPFGMEMSERTLNGGSYRYGFGGHEKDDEITGNGNHYDFMGYGYSPLIGRRWNTDPVIVHSMSSYATFNNNPNFYVDPDGRSPISILAKQVAKLGLKKAAKKLVKAQIKKRLKAYTGKKWAGQIAEDALTAIDIASGQAWWEYALEVVPIVGDAYGGYKLTETGYKVYKLVDKFETIAKFAGNAAKHAWKTIKPFKKLTGKGADKLQAIIDKSNKVGEHLSEMDLVGAVRDIFGNPVMDVAKGRPYAHLNEVNDAYNGLTNQIKKLRRGLIRKEFDGDVIDKANELLIELQKRKDKISAELDRALKAAEEFKDVVD